MSLTKAQIDLILDVVFDARVAAEDAIDLEKQGIPSGHKKGVLQTKLKRAKEAYGVLEALQENTKKGTK